MEILKFEKKSIQKSYLTISILGSIYKLNIKYINGNLIELNKKEDCFELVLPKKYKNTDNIEIINHAISKLYVEIAETELEYALEMARIVTKYAPDDYIIKRLNNDYYKISKNILLVNPDIVQYSTEVISVTLIQAFCKMQYKPSTKKYKEALKQAMQKYESYKIQNKKNRSIAI